MPFILLLRILAVCSPPVVLAAQAGPEPMTGLLVVAHGADSGWNAGVVETVAQVRWDGPVEVAFLMGPAARERGWNAGVSRLERAGVARLVVVPLMISSHGAHTRQIRHYADPATPLPEALADHVHGAVRRPSVPTVVTPAIDGADELGAILFDRWSVRAERSRRRPVVFVAHGPGSDADAARWHADLSRALGAMRAQVGTDRFRVAQLRDDADPPIRAAAVAALRDTIRVLAARSGDSVLVMTVLVSSGAIDRRKIPAELAGLPVDYVGSVLAPHPALSRWIERMGREALALNPQPAAAASPPAPR